MKVLKSAFLANSCFYIYSPCCVCTFILSLFGLMHYYYKLVFFCSQFVNCDEVFSNLVLVIFFVTVKRDIMKWL